MNTTLGYGFGGNRVTLIKGYGDKGVMFFVHDSCESTFGGASFASRKLTQPFDLHARTRSLSLTAVQHGNDPLVCPKYCTYSFVYAGLEIRFLEPFTAAVQITYSCPFDCRTQKILETEKLVQAGFLN